MKTNSTNVFRLFRNNLKFRMSIVQTHIYSRAKDDSVLKNYQTNDKFEMHVH